MIDKAKEDIYLSGAESRAVRRVSFGEGTSYQGIFEKFDTLAVDVWKNLAEKAGLSSHLSGSDTPKGLLEKEGDVSFLKIENGPDEYPDHIEVVMVSPWPAKPDHYEQWSFFIPRSRKVSRGEPIYIQRYIGHRGSSGLDTREFSTITPNGIKTKFEEGPFSSRGDKLMADELAFEHPDFGRAAQKLDAFTTISDSAIDPALIEEILKEKLSSLSATTKVSQIH